MGLFNFFYILLWRKMFNLLRAVFYCVFGFCGIVCFRGRGFVLEGRENILGKVFCSKYRGFGFEYLFFNYRFILS